MLTASLIKWLSLSDVLEQQCAFVFKHFSTASMMISISIDTAIEITAVMMIMVELISILASLMNLMFPMITAKLPNLTYHGHKYII